MKKLIRDNIPKLAKESDRPIEYYIANEKEYKERVIDKIGEEAKELQEALTREDPKAIYNELVDMYEILAAINNIFPWFNIYEAYDARDNKARERGIFDKRYVGVFKDEDTDK